MDYNKKFLIITNKYKSSIFNEFDKNLNYWKFSLNKRNYDYNNFNRIRKCTVKKLLQIIKFQTYLLETNIFLNY